MSTQRTILLVCAEGSLPETDLLTLQFANANGRIVLVNDEVAALKRITSEHFDCVFSYSPDEPENSVNFLNEVWNRAPGVGRYVLAPNIDPETQIRCAFGAHHYLSAPLNGKAVQTALIEAQARNAIVPNDRVQLLISRTRTLPSRPTIYFDVLRELESQNPDATAVAAIIQKDAGVSSKLIQIVNSLFYGRAQATYDMEEAVLFLGFEVTASIVLSLEAISRFERIQPLPASAEEVWAHSQAVAELSRSLCRSMGRDRTSCEQAYLAGLLHDIGKLVLAQNFRDEYWLITRRVVEEKRPLIDVEKEVLGVAHADAGAYLLAVWGLPVAVIEAVASHHADGVSHGPDLSLAEAVHLAEEILESDRPLEELLSAYPPALGLPKLTETFNMLAASRPVAAIP